MIKSIKKSFCQIITQQQSILSNLKPIDNSIVDYNEEKLVEEAKRTGSDLILPEEVKVEIKKSGVITEESQNVPSYKGSYITYLKNMGLIREYQEVFREFFQAIARQDENYMDLVCESKLGDYIINRLDQLRKKGYIIEIDNLKINYEFELVDWKVYKNLHVRREDNNIPFEFDHYGKKLSIARYINQDKSWFDNETPFILSSTLKIKTPFKLVVYNQNFSKKIYGKEKEDVIEYIVKFETMLGYTDFLWILPTVNKPSRLRKTRIVDFNNVLNGNVFEENIKSRI